MEEEIVIIVDNNKTENTSHGDDDGNNWEKHLNRTNITFGIVITCVIASAYMMFTNGAIIFYVFTILGIILLCCMTKSRFARCHVI